MRISIDTGGTFTDLVIETDHGFRLFKRPTTPDDPACGILDVVSTAADAMGLSTAKLLSATDTVIHATTHAINAILTGTTARTAFLTTKGHPDILLIREGGKERFNLPDPYPDPYVPRALTWEVSERVDAMGRVIVPLAESQVISVASELRQLAVEAVGVCFLWSIVNPDHESRVGRILATELPDVPVTLSHRLNPSLREYRRASSTVIDASLRPVMGPYLASLDERLRAAGFRGRLLIVTSAGGVVDSADVVESPIHVVNSGPAMAPVAGRHYGGLDTARETLIVADAGGTSYDVSLVRNGEIPWTREKWLGRPYLSHMSGFPSVDVRSIGAGGGSIARVDEGGLLHVGPDSAGSVPGPACYARGGVLPTVTDAALVLGYLDPMYFLGGAMPLDSEAARTAVAAYVGGPLCRDTEDAAASILSVATEQMVRVIEEITLNQGVDPRGTVLVGGGGAAGLNAVMIARRLGCRAVLIPDVGATLSAAGALLSDLSRDFFATFPTSSDRFDAPGVAMVLRGLQTQAEAFVRAHAVASKDGDIRYSVEARYPDEIWELEVPLDEVPLEESSLGRVRDRFHQVHHEVFAVADTDAPVELVAWRARATVKLPTAASRLVRWPLGTIADAVERRTYSSREGWETSRLLEFAGMPPGARTAGPLVIESPVTTVVIERGVSAMRTEAGSIWIDLGSI